MEKASLVQELAIPVILKGRNSLIIAPTGMGKTLAAVLPVFDRLLKLKGEQEVRGISVLYITPLRALNRDIYRRLVELGVALDIDVRVRHGDTPAKARELQARFPPDMLITTPETLQAILPGKRMKEHLRSVRWVIVDEIHELATDKRGTQLSIGLERLCNLAGRDFQRIGLSATVGEAEKASAFLGGVSREVEVVRSPEIKRFDVTVDFPVPSQSDAEDAERLGIPANYVSRVKEIIELIRGHRSTLIFTNTREHAEALGALVRALDAQLAVRVHHGSLSKEIREDVEQRFQEGEVKGVICTSSLELGIDVGTVELVVQYMSPRQATKLVQRIGRSGHALDTTPKGRIIAGWADDILESIVLLKRAKGEDLERLSVFSEPFDVLAHQLVGLTLDEKEMPVEKAYSIITRSYPYRDLATEDFMDTVNQLERINLLKVRDSTLRVKSLRAYQYYFENLSVIPDVKRFTVFDFISKRRIGSLDQEFVAKRCTSGTDFIMHGHTWRVVSKDEEKRTVDVEPTTPSLDAIPSWEGEIIPVEYETAMEVGRLRQSIADSLESEDALQDLAGETGATLTSITKVAETIHEHLKNFLLPAHNRMTMERFENSVVIHACFGNLVNETLGLALTTLLNSRYNISSRYQADPYRLAIVLPYPVDPFEIKKSLSNLKPGELAPLVERSLEASDAFLWRLWHVARRFGVIERKADYSTSKARTLAQIFKGSPIDVEAKKELFTEKLDIRNTESVLSRIQSKDIAVDIVGVKDLSCSPLAMPILDKLVPHDLLRPATVTKPLAQIVQERLLSERVKLVCMHKGDWEGIRVVKQLDQKISCSRCRSTLTAVTYPDDNELLRTVRKKRGRQKLTEGEAGVWIRGWRSASLVQVYGKKAVIALAARGVGPTTATRILRRPHHREDEFYVDILKAERNFARTRSFWD